MVQEISQQSLCKKILFSLTWIDLKKSSFIIFCYLIAKLVP